ncbi:hypothetical protein [Glycomyces sp. NPDC021274]|uniref:hypothetical protein n=1 Tax=Glycomyces sp. NPDC021274 TaxID=3155120 RepID=UPI00340867A3
MRLHHPLAALVLAGALTAAGPAPAATAAEADAAPPADSGTITLPTGDQVRLTADGSFLTDPAGGAFHTATEPDGDRLLIPVEALGDLADGTLTTAQFNIDALARNGISDAGDPGAAELLADETDAAAVAADAVPVDFTALWSDGSAPEVVSLRWAEIDTGELGSEMFEGGTATVDMAPGRYHVVVLMDKFDLPATIAGVIELEVGADTEPVVFDGAAAEATGFAVEREAEAQAIEVDVFSNVPGTRDGNGGGLLAGPEWSVSVVPTDFDTTGRDVGFVLRQELVSPEDARKPYSYSLFGLHDDGIPANPVFSYEDEDLAKMKMDYQSLGVDTLMGRSNLSYHPIHSASGYRQSGIVAAPSKRTEYYSAHPEVDWSHMGTFGFDAEGDEPYADVLHHSGTLRPGSSAKSTWNQGPITAGVDLAGVEYFLPRFARMDSYEVLLTNPSLFSSGAPGEAINSYESPGQTVLSQDGLGVSKSEYGGSLATELALVGEGRYELYTEATRDVPWTNLGTAATAEWEFTVPSGGTDVILPVSVVNFDAEDIENGYADADDDQDVELEFATQPGAEQQVCTAMTFEVSYDDGATWDLVDIDREGDSATAELEHPEDAAFVSVRFTAADEAGNTVTHTTIRSYGLR